MRWGRRFGRACRWRACRSSPEDRAEGLSRDLARARGCLRKRELRQRRRTEAANKIDASISPQRNCERVNEPRHYIGGLILHDKCGAVQSSTFRLPRLVAAPGQLERWVACIGTWSGSDRVKA